MKTKVIEESRLLQIAENIVGEAIAAELARSSPEKRTGAEAEQLVALSDAAISIDPAITYLKRE